MSTIEFAEELNQQRRRFSTTSAMTAETAELAFRQNISPWKRDMFLPSRGRNGDYR